MSGVKGMHKRRSTSPSYVEAVRARIRAGGIVDRLEKHVLGKLEMSNTQVQAALGLLKKVVPDQQAIEHSGEVAAPIGVSRFMDLIENAARTRADSNGEGMGTERSVLSTEIRPTTH